MTTRWTLFVPLALFALACNNFGDPTETGNAEEPTSDATDLPGDGDGDPSGDGDGDPGGEVTIYDIQQGAADGDVVEGTNFALTQVVVTTPINVDDGLVFVEEPAGGEWSGISLYLYDEVAMAHDLQPGDVVDLVGEYAEFFGMSQLVVKNVGDIVVVRSGDPLPGPDVVDAASVARTNPAAEPWEGVRVQIQDAVIAEPNDGFGQYLLEGDALVGNAFIDPLPGVAVAGTFESVTGSLHYSFDEFKVQPGTLADLAGYMDPPAPMTDTPIQDIQQGMVPENSLVLVENVIVSSGLTWSDAADASFFVQEPGGGAFSGIQVYIADTAGLAIAPGDDVTIVGTYEEFFDMSQLAVSGAMSVTVNGSGAPPTPELIADPSTIATGGAAAEDWEGVLVTVETVTVTNENPDAPMEFGEFEVTGGLRVDDLFFAMADWTKPLMGAMYTSITGVLVYNFSNFKLEPRDANDLVAN